MNKTIIININGQVFHIEEDAYEVIRVYMTDVKRHFAYSPDSDEIVTDIENRLAEMFAERLAKEHKQVIVLQDVQEVTAQMGSVSDFGTEDDGETFTRPEKVQKKLFRDIDDRVIGGVCSGIGHYFDIEARWIRVLFLLIVFLGGTGIMAYIILWIVMPKADTRAEKMAMKGERINIQNFKKNFDEEVEALRHNFNHAATEARPALQKLGAFVRDLVGHFLAFFRGAAKILVKLLGGFIVLAGGMVLLGLIVGLFTALGFWHDELEVFPVSMINPEYRGILFVSGFLLLFIPLIALVLFAVRVIFNRAIVTKSASFGMLVLWIIGLSCAIFYGTRVASEFQEEASLTQTTDLKQSPVYYLKLDGAKFLSHDDSVRYNIDSASYNGRVVISVGDEDLEMPDNFRLRVEKSDTDKPVLIQEFSARGRTFETALQRAQNIRYQFRQQDSVLHFNQRANLAKDDLWRDQEVRLTLKVPANTRMIIDTRLDRYFQDFYLWNCAPEGSHGNVPTEWLMTADGLKCKDDSLYRKRSGWEN